MCKSVNKFSKSFSYLYVINISYSNTIIIVLYRLQFNFLQIVIKDLSTSKTSELLIVKTDFSVSTQELWSCDLQICIFF